MFIKLPSCLFFMIVAKFRLYCQANLSESVKFDPPEIIISGEIEVICFYRVNDPLSFRTNYLKNFPDVIKTALLTFDVIDAVLVSLLLTLNIFHTFLYYFYC